MVEPISTALAGIALVKASVDGIKSAIGTAKDVRDIASQLDNLFNGHRQVQAQANKKAGGFSNFDGIGSTASEMIDKKLAEEALYEMQVLIDMRFGHGTFASIKQEFQRRIKAQRDEERRQKQLRAKQRAEMVENLWVVLIVLAVLAVVVVIGLASWMAMASNWSNDLTTCRLVKCMKIDDDGTSACVYRGAHNTQELLVFAPREFKPREYLCQWKVDQPPPPNIYDALEAIKDSRN